MKGAHTVLLMSLGLSVLGGCSDPGESAAEVEPATAPDIQVDRERLEFDQLEIGGSATKRLNVSNIGDAPLEVAAVLVQDLDGLGGVSFTLLNEDFPQVLSPNDSLELSIQYTAAAELSQGMMTIVSNDPDTPSVRVPLFGGLHGPQLQLSPIGVDFGVQGLVCGPALADVELLNIGTEPVQFTDISVDNPRFDVDIERGTFGDLAPGDRRLLSVQFQPNVVGVHEGVLTVESNDDDDPALTVALSGVGEAGGPCNVIEQTTRIGYNIVDVAVVINTTASMGGAIAGLQNDMQRIAEALFGEIEDVTFGVAEYRDYAAAGMGGPMDRPFTLQMQQTSELRSVQTALDSLRAGGIGQDASMEALFQALTGQGYDQNCDGDYDDESDVQPFKRRADDAFGGTVTGSQSGAIEGSGPIGGMGFRHDVLSVVLFATDGFLRDPDKGDPSPGGCTTVGINGSDAGGMMAREAADAIRAKIIGVGVDYTVNDDRYAQMAEISDRITIWDTGTDDFDTTIVNTILDLLEDETFDTVELQVRQDIYNLVGAVTPDRWTDVPAGTDVTFSIATLDEGVVFSEPTADTTEIIIDVWGTRRTRSLLLDSFTVHAQIPDAYRE
ncbi:MAG: choice-of-anchor D domain-containing protein [Myxococcota bacterium]